MLSAFRARSPLSYIIIIIIIIHRISNALRSEMDTSYIELQHSGVSEIITTLRRLEDQELTKIMMISQGQQPKSRISQGHR